MADKQKGQGTRKPGQLGPWIDEVPKTGGTVSGSPQPLPAGASQEVIDLYNLDPAQRALIAQSLKRAGYNKVPTNGSFSPALVDSYIDALGKAQTLSLQLGREFNPATDFSEYISQRISDEELSGGGRAGQSISTTVYTPDQAASLVDAVYKNLTGEKAPEAEKLRLIKQLERKQRSAPSITTYTQSGTTQTSTTTPGVNAEQFLVEEISQTNPAKANKALQGYEILMNKLGGLR